MLGFNSICEIPISTIYIKSTWALYEFIDLDITMSFKAYARVVIFTDDNKVVSFKDYNTTVNFIDSARILSFKDKER